MTDFVLVVVIVAFFVVAALLVRVLDHMIAGSAEEADRDDEALAAETSERELEPGRPV